MLICFVDFQHDMHRANALTRMQDLKWDAAPLSFHCHISSKWNMTKVGPYYFLFYWALLWILGCGARMRWGSRGAKISCGQISASHPCIRWHKQWFGRIVVSLIENERIVVSLIENELIVVSLIENERVAGLIENERIVVSLIENERNCRSTFFSLCQSGQF